MRCGDVTVPTLRSGSVGRLRLSGLTPLLIFLALAVGGCGGDSGNAKRVNVLFPDRDGVQAGDPVRYQGFEIGQVSSLEPAPGNVIRVAVDIDRDYAENVRKGAEFSIEDAPNGDDDKIVRLSMPKRDTPLLPDSATVVGEGDRWEELLESWGQEGEELREEAEESLGPWIERIRQEVRERTGG